MEEDIKKPELPKVESREPIPAASAEGIPEKAREAQESAMEDQRISQELRREIEMMHVDETLQQEVKVKSQTIQYLAEDEKIKHLLQIAREKGLVFAIKVAKDTNDPYILDTLHDLLVKEGFYKSFIKK